MISNIIKDSIIFPIIRDTLDVDAAEGTQDYSVLGFDPHFVADFIDNKYFIDAELQNKFADAITHSRSSNAVMVDSSGYLKFAPHNLIDDSDDLTGLGSVIGATRTATVLTEDTSTGAHSIQSGYLPVVGEKYTLACEVKLESGTRFVAFRGFGEGGANKYPIFNLVNGTIEDSGTSFTDVSITDVGGGYYLLKASIVAASAFTWQIHLQNSTTSGSGGYEYTGDGTSAIALRKIRQYRSDLGGMVDNPDKSGLDADFVPTTGTIAYLPRIGHHVYAGNAYTNEGLLAESEARTNLYDNNDSMHTNSTQNSTLSANAGTAPDGTNDAVKLLETTATAEHTVLMAQSVITTGKTFTCSVFVKSVGGRNAKFGFTGVNFPSAARINFDLANVTSATPSQSTIQEMGNDWYRLSVTATSDATGSRGDTNVILQSLSGTTSSFAGDTAKGLLFYGMQIEEGFTPSSFIPTVNTTTATRAAETFTIPSANLSWNNSNVAIALDGRITFADEDVTNTATVYDWTEDSDNRIYARIRTDSAKTGQYQALQEESGTTSGRVSDTNYFTPNIFVPLNVAARHGSTFINLALDGEDVGESTAPTALPDLSSTDLDLADDYMGTIGTFRIWDQDIGDEGIEEATNPSLEPSLSLTFEDTGTNSFVVMDWSE